MADEFNKNTMYEMGNNKSEGKNITDEIDDNKLDEKLKKEEENLIKFKDRRATLDEKIKECESNIERLKLLKDNRKYTKLANSVQKKGLTVEDIISALQSGDLLSLQEKIESNAEEVEPPKQEV
jgi:hypothetical protein